MDTQTQPSTPSARMNSDPDEFNKANSYSLSVDSEKVLLASIDSDTVDNIIDKSHTATQNKSLLISAALDEMGMGRYQWCIFFLCGLGFFIDLLWAQALGLIAGPIKNEFSGVTDSNIGLLSTAFSVGLTIGAFTWGFMVDVVGRRWSFYLTCLISSVFGLAAGAPDTYWALCTLCALTGFGVGGNIPIDAVITMEFLPTNRRFLLALLSVFQPIGVLVCSGVAYGFIPAYSCGISLSGTTAVTDCPKSTNMGWRYMLFTLGGMTLAVFLLRFVIFDFHESPAYLMNRGKEAEALEVLAKISKFNGVATPAVTLEHFDEIDRQMGQPIGVRREVATSQTTKQQFNAMIANLKQIKLLFSTSVSAQATILIWLVFIADFWGFSIAGYFLPQILADKGAVGNVSISQTYLDYVIIYAPGIPACFLGAAMVEVPRLGRKWAMVVSSAMMAISLFLYGIVDTEAGNVGINAMEYFFQSMFNAILYGFIPEVYPSATRGSACGIASTWGRLAGILAPIAGEALYTGASSNGVLYIGGGVALLCPVALALLPYDTRGKRAY